MELDMPTFEDIKLGRCVYDIHGRFLGLDDDGNYRFSRSYRQLVCVRHNYYDCLFNMFIKLDRKGNPINLYCCC